MKKIIMVFLLMSLLACPFKSYAAEKVLDYNVSVRIVFGFGNNYDIEKFSKFANKTIRSKLSHGYTMFESKGVWKHHERGVVRENNIIIIYDMVDNQQTQETLASVAKEFVKLFEKSGGSVYVVKTPILEAKSYF